METRTTEAELSLRKLNWFIEKKTCLQKINYYKELNFYIYFSTFFLLGQNIQNMLCSGSVDKVIGQVTYMRFLNKFLLGDFPHTVQVGAVTAGHQRHHSPTGLWDGEKKNNISICCHVTFSLNQTPRWPHICNSMRREDTLILKEQNEGRVKKHRRLQPESPLHNKFFRGCLHEFHSLSATHTPRSTSRHCPTTTTGGTGSVSTEKSRKNAEQ